MKTRTLKRAAGWKKRVFKGALIGLLGALFMMCVPAAAEESAAQAETVGTLAVVAAPVEGMDADRCQVTVTLGDALVNGTYGEAEFAFGRAMLELSSGEEALIPGLPAGTVYTVAEQEGRAGIRYPEEEGPHRIRAGEEARVILERPENTLGRLRLTCARTGQDTDPDGMYRFRIGTDARELNGRYGDLVFENGEAEIRLKAGESCVAPGLPDGTRYRIDCEEAPENTVFNSAGEAGVLRGGRESRAAFTFAGKTDGLRIRLNCDGNDPDPGRTFRIRVELTDEAGETWTAWHEDPFRAGKATLPMTDGEILCLPIYEELTPAEVDTVCDVILEK